MAEMDAAIAEVEYFFKNFILKPASGEIISERTYVIIYHGKDTFICGRRYWFFFFLR